MCAPPLRPGRDRINPLLVARFVAPNSLKRSCLRNALSSLRFLAGNTLCFFRAEPCLNLGRSSGLALQWALALHPPTLPICSRRTLRLRRSTVPRSRVPMLMVPRYHPLGLRRAGVINKDHPAV